MELSKAVHEQVNPEVTGIKGSYTLHELLDFEHRHMPFLWGQIIPQVGLTILTGASDCNKSTFLRQLACSIAADENKFLELPLLARKKNVIYLSTEDDQHAMSFLFKKQLNVVGEKPGWTENIICVFDFNDYLVRLHRALLRKPCSAVFVDAWADLFHDDLNQSNKVRNHLEKFVELSKKHQCAVILVHHQRKGAEDRVTHKGDMLGSQGIEAKARCVIELKKDSSNQRSLRILKGNYTPEAVKDVKIILSVNENLQLSHVRNEGNDNYTIEEKVFREQKKLEIKQKLFSLREEGISFAKIHEQLSEKFGTEMVSETTLKNWMNDKMVSQPNT